MENSEKKNRSKYGGITLDEFIEGKLTTADIRTFDDLVYFRKLHAQAEKVNEYQTANILSGLYDDPSHFVYEILQNADDVGAKTVHFILSKDKIKIWHDGDDFNFNDVIGITGIGNSPKKEDLNSIGTFGVGFKSVFAITESPCIFSGEYNFKIEKFVLPIPMSKIYPKTGTWIIIPFNHPIRTSEEIFDKISHKLNEMGLDTLLFLRNIEKIECKINDNSSGTYTKKIDLNENYKQIILTYSNNKDTLRKEKWLVFERKLSGNEKLKVELAYKVGKDDKAKEKIMPVERAKLFVFFSTAIETGLHFVIQGPYRTTPARDNVPFEENMRLFSWGEVPGSDSDKLIEYLKQKFSIDWVKTARIEKINDGKAIRVSTQKNNLSLRHNDEKTKMILEIDDGRIDEFIVKEESSNLNIYENWNKMLIRETANLVADSLPIIKEVELLNVHFLSILPINKTHINENFTPIFEKVKEKLKSEEEILPADKNEYISAKDALLVRGTDLRNLLSNEQLYLLFERTNWLDSEITTDKSRELREYLMDELEIPEIDPERFAKNFDEKFIREQTDEWIIKFYKFLLGQKALWRKGGRGGKEGVLRNKPLIRIQKEDNDYHTHPFDSEGNSLAYLPSKNKSINELPFWFVKRNIVDNPEAKEFLSLQNLGLREPDATAWILEKVLPKYFEENDDLNVSLDDNIQHVIWISKALEKSLDIELKQKLMDGLGDTNFLYTKNIGTSEELYRSPNEGIYLGEAYTGNKDIETFFEGNDEIWILNERYKGVLDVETLNLIGCETEVQVFFEEPEWDKNVYIEHYQFYKRGLDGFDPECEIDGLEHALKTITIDKAEILWNTLISSQNYKRIKGTIEESSRKDFSSVGKHYEKYSDFSKMGKLLVKYNWLPDRNGDYDKPSNLLLTDLPDEFDKESFEAIIIGEKLGLKTPKEQEIYDQLSNETKRVFDIVNQIFQTGQENKIIEILEKIIEQPQIVEVTKSREEIGSTFINSLASTSPSSSETSDTQSNGWSGSTPDEEDASETEYEVMFPQELDDLQSEVRHKVIKESEIKSKSGRHINGKEFLKEQYDGHCQICNTQLDLGNGNPFFYLTHIAEVKHERAWGHMVWNILCLCPNCHALIKHGRNNDLNAIQQIAISASEHEIAPEPIDERNGDFYIINIKLAGKERQLFYTPNHMRKISVLIKQTNKDSDGAV